MTKTSTVTTFKQLGAHLAGKRAGRPEMIARATTPGPPKINHIFLCTFAVFMVLYL